jgi:hypothetical protein
MIADMKKEEILKHLEDIRQDLMTSDAPDSNDCHECVLYRKERASKIKALEFAAWFVEQNVSKYVAWRFSIDIDNEGKNG